MGEMETEIQAVKNRHVGQCPLEKDHEGFFVQGFFVGLFVSVAFAALMSYLGSDDSVGALKKQAIQRGYAQYDAGTGAWKWR
jgi:hypothetical protein